MPTPAGLRPEVLAFAIAMERKLRTQDAASGQSWKDADIDYLLDRLADEVVELNGAVVDGAHVLGEAVDVANFAMMVADRRGSLLYAPAAPSEPARA